MLRTHLGSLTDLGFKSLHECHAWIIGNFDASQYRLAMEDPFLLMLECICFWAEFLGGTMLKVLESRLEQIEAVALNTHLLSYTSPYHQSHNHQWKGGDDGGVECVKMSIPQQLARLLQELELTKDKVFGTT